jgi:ribonuclease J
VKLIIHRGTKEIGGSCVELASGNTRIIIDLGLPLVDKKGGPFDSSVLKGKSIGDLVSEGILPDVKGLYRNGNRGINAVFLSHSHQDHYGLLGYIHPEIPVYMSQGAKILIEISNLFIPIKVNLPNVVVLEKWQPIEIDDFVVKPYLVDHSAPDARAFLVKSKMAGERLFYSGDFRGHGRKKVVLDNLISHPVKNVDCLVMEGTMLGRADNGYENEDAVEARMAEIFRLKENIAFVFCSSQNIDRLVSIYRAAKRAQQTLVIDLYTAYILHRLKSISRRLPQYWWDDIKVIYFPYHAKVLAKNELKDFLYRCKSAKIEREEVNRYKKNIVMVAKYNYDFIRLLGYIDDLAGAAAIYSMWEGYLEKSNLRETLKQKGVELETVHTSGHATEQDLSRLAQAFKPKCLVPIHTFQPQEYLALFPNVHMLNDGEEFVL